MAWDELSYQGSIFLQPGIWSSQKFVNRSTSMASKPQVFNVFLWPRCQLEVSPRKVWYQFYVIQNGSYWSMIKDNHRWERGTIHEFDFSEQKISGRHQRATVWYCQQQDCCSSFTSTGSEVGTFLMKCLIPPEGSNSRKEKDLTSESWKWTLKSLIVIILQVTTPAT